MPLRGYRKRSGADTGAFAYGDVILAPEYLLHLAVSSLTGAASRYHVAKTGDPGAENEGKQR